MSSSEIKTKTYQITPRDRTCLTWVAFQYAIRLDQLQRLLFRHTPEADRYKLKAESGRLSLDRTYEIIKKWLALDLIEKKTILHGDQLWIWASRQGLREMQQPFNFSGAPSSIRLPHLYAINQVRMEIEKKRPEDVWKSERRIRKETPATIQGENQPHTPDAILYAASGKVTAIEVECHEKTESELEDDLRELAVSYRSVWYFTTRTTRRQIEAMLDTFEPEVKKPFVLYDLKEYTGNEYGIS
jgi:hypothetical protein